MPSFSARCSLQGKRALCCGLRLCCTPGKPRLREETTAFINFPAFLFAPPLPPAEFRFPSKTRERSSRDGHGRSKELYFRSIPLGFLRFSLALQHLDKPYCKRPWKKELKPPSASTSTSKSHSAAQEPQKPFPGDMQGTG